MITDIVDFTLAMFVLLLTTLKKPVIGERIYFLYIHTIPS